MSLNFTVNGTSISNNYVTFAECGLTSPGALWVWGNNNNGQLSIKILSVAQKYLDFSSNNYYSLTLKEIAS